MSDWEQASRNAFEEVFHKFAYIGVYFTILNEFGKVSKTWSHSQFQSNPRISKYTHLLMAIPFLPPSLIVRIFDLIATPSLEPSQASIIVKLKRYIKKYWFTQISSEELSIFDISISMNNGAESHHSKLKARIRTSHPRIWLFLSQLNDSIVDTDNDIGRIRLGREISRARKPIYVHIDEQRMLFKEKFRNIPHSNFWSP